MEGGVGLATTTVSKQSAQDRYGTEITAIGCPDRLSLTLTGYTNRWFTRPKTVTHPTAPDVG